MEFSSVQFMRGTVDADGRALRPDAVGCGRLREDVAGTAARCVRPQLGAASAARRRSRVIVIDDQAVKLPAKHDPT